MHVLYGSFTPGESPFRVRGNVYLNIFASYEARVPGGKKAVLERIEDPHVVAFFAQEFKERSTYDVLPLIEIGQVASRAAGIPWREFVRAGASYQAEKDAGGIYRLFLKIATPRLTVERLPRLLIQYFNFGAVEGRLTDATSFEATASGIPKSVVPWLHASVEGFIPTVLHITGAKDVTVHVAAPEREGEQHGMEICRARFSVTWK